MPLALSSSIHSTAAAPSEICDEVPAVWMAPSITGFNEARPSAVVSRRPWSRVTGAHSSVGRLFSSSTGAEIGEISRSKRPSAQACLALVCEASPNASRSARVMPRRLAIRSAASNWFGMSMSHDDARMMLRSGPALAPSPTRLIASMPQAMPMSMAPVAIRPATRWLACWALPHWQSMVVAPTCSGSPAVSQPTLVMLFDCSPY